MAHLHPGDPEARVMKCGTVYTLAFNAQAVVDHESDLVVGIHVVNDESDSHQLVPMLERAERTVGQRAEVSVADGGYVSGTQIDEAQRKHLPVLVELPELDDKPYAKHRFSYDRARDVFVCPEGRPLKPIGTQKAGKAVDYERTVYRCDPTGCPVRAQCTEQSRGRTVSRTPYDDALERQRTEYLKPSNQILQGLRKEIIEHLFGIVKGNDGFRRLTVRGLPKAKAQWGLACLAVNLRKLHAFWKEGRFPGLGKAGLHAA